MVLLVAKNRRDEWIPLSSPPPPRCYVVVQFKLVSSFVCASAFGSCNKLGLHLYNNNTRNIQRPSFIRHERVFLDLLVAPPPPPPWQMLRDFPPFEINLIQK